MTIMDIGTALVGPSARLGSSARGGPSSAVRKQARAKPSYFGFRFQGYSRLFKLIQRYSRLLAKFNFKNKQNRLPAPQSTASGVLAFHLRPQAGTLSGLIRLNPGKSGHGKYFEDQQKRASGQSPAAVSPQPGLIGGLPRRYPTRHNSVKCWIQWLYEKFASPS